MSTGKLSSSVGNKKDPSSKRKEEAYQVLDSQENAAPPKPTGNHASCRNDEQEKLEELYSKVDEGVEISPEPKGSSIFMFFPVKVRTSQS